MYIYMYANLLIFVLANQVSIILMTKVLYLILRLHNFFLNILYIFDLSLIFICAFLCECNHIIYRMYLYVHTYTRGHKIHEAIHRIFFITGYLVVTITYYFSLFFFFCVNTVKFHIRKDLKFLIHFS